jgi:hypothetical protein
MAAEGTWSDRAIAGAEVGLTVGTAYGAIMGACCGLPVGLLYGAAWIITCPLYGLAGAVLGLAAGAIVGAAGGAMRSARVGAVAGCGAGFVLGLVLLAWSRSVAVEAGGPEPSEPINPAATAEEESELERRYAQWRAERVAEERSGLVVLAVAPAILSVIMASCGAAWALRRRSIPHSSEPSGPPITGIS